MSKLGFSGVCYVVWVVVLAVIGWTAFRIEQDINGWKSRAQVSSEPNDMLVYMTNVKEGMETWGMTSGNAALVWKTPANDMGLIYKTVVNHVDQAQVLTQMDRDTPEYQTGLDNLRGSIRELELHGHSHWMSHDGLLIRFIAWTSFALGSFGLVWIWLEDPYL